MPERTCPVRWLGQQAVVTLPEHIDRSNADRIREQLLLVINRGAAGMIADLSATISCDYSGTDAVARAYQRAVASGAELRLVAVADVIRRVLALSGLDRLVSVYPTVEAAIAAGTERRDEPDEPDEASPGVSTRMGAEPARVQSTAADPADRAAELLEWVVTTIFNVGMSLQVAIGLPREATTWRITEALGGLNDVVREIHGHVYAEHSRKFQPGGIQKRLLNEKERSALSRSRSASLQQRVVQTAHALQYAAEDTAELLERRADILGQPGPIDYPTEVKRWRALADQAEEMAERWERTP